MRPPTLIVLLSLSHRSLASVTVYNTQFDSTATATAPGAVWTGVGSQDPLRLNPPPPPDPTSHLPIIPVQLYDGGMTGLGRPVSGDFLGFSIELSVFQPLFGINSTHVRPEFLNHLAILQQRGGGVTIRVGGNSQDRARIVDTLPNGTAGIIYKEKAENTGPTETPVVFFTAHVLEAMKTVADLLNVRYFFGIPFLETNADGNAGKVVATAQSILGDKLLGLQMANEPDLYGKHQKKQADYSIQNFFQDTTSMIQSLPLPQKIMMGPSVCCEWDAGTIFDQGYVSTFDANLKYISLMRYPNNNCANPGPVPQDIFKDYLTHSSASDYVSGFGTIVERSIQAGKPFIMLESNTASCGGFPGISDSFGASLWASDMGLKMASANFTNALWHVGGQNVYYNAFTPPPTNQTSFRKWTTGSIFYSNIFLAEVLGRSGKAQVIDLNLNNGRVFTPGYAIYEEGKVARVALINFIDDPSGANDYTAAISIGGTSGLPGVTPTKVFVKYLHSSSVSEKWKITWANQTLGGQFGSDGRLYGGYSVVSIDCANNVCNIPVKAPEAALVFFSEQALANSSPSKGPDGQDPLVFTTSTVDGPIIDWASVAASNGRNGQLPLGSTSKGSKDESSARSITPTLSSHWVALGTLLLLACSTL